MLRIRIDINGREIATIGVVNTSEIEDGEHKYKVYDCRGIEEGDYVPDYPKICEVYHDRSEGASTLTKKVVEEIDEEQFSDRNI